MFATATYFAWACGGRNAANPSAPGEEDAGSEGAGGPVPDASVLPGADASLDASFDSTAKDSGPADSTVADAVAAVDAASTDSPAEDVGGGDATSASGDGAVQNDAAPCTECGAVCVDTSTDPNNCGACAQSCATLAAGATCQGGVCMAQLATAPGALVALAMDATNVYWAGGSPPSGGIWSVPLDGGTPVQLAATTSLTGLALGATNLYWTDDETQTVDSVPIGGGAVTTLASGLASPAGIVTDATSAYWLEGEAILTMPLAGGSPTTLATVGLEPSTLAVGAGAVFYAQGTDASGIGIIPLDGGAWTSVGDAYANAVVVDQTTVFLFGQYTGDYIVATVPVGGGPETPIAETFLDTPIAGDQTNFYWGNTWAGGIWRLPKDGGAPAIVAPQQPDPGFVAAYGGVVAWAEYTQLDGGYDWEILMARVK